MSSLHLRDYQEDIIIKTRQALAKHKRVLVQAPTGAGKTVLSSFMLDAAAKKEHRCWFIVHRQELIEQTAYTFDRCMIPYGVVASGFPVNPYCAIQICSIQTLVNRLARLPKPSFIVWDECHHLGASSWDRVLRAFPDAWHVGLSATPYRLDGVGLGRWFEVMVRGPSVRWLIDNGHLSDYRLFAPATPDLSGVHTRAGDFVASELDEIMSGKAIVGGIVKHWLKHARGLRTIGFAPSIKSSQEYVHAFRQAGIMAVHLDGKMSRQDRRMAGRAFANGEIQILWNVDLFGEGFDLAALAGRDVTIEAGILARPTQSLGLHLQQIGRTLRKKDRPAVILDHSGNTLRHGLPCEEREWSLEDRDRKRKGDSEEAAISVRQCPKCFLAHRPAPRCPQCGHVYEIKERIIDTIDNDLAEVNVSELRKRRQIDMEVSNIMRKEATGELRDNALSSLIEFAKRRKFRNPEKWGAYEYTRRLAGRNK